MDAHFCWWWHHISDEYQTDGFQHSNDAPSLLQFSNLTFSNWTGTSLSNKSEFRPRLIVYKIVDARETCTDYRSILQVVDLECSPAVPCPNMIFHDLEVTPPTGQGLSFVCKNVVNESGLPGKCGSIFGQAWHYVEHGG